MAKAVTYKIIIIICSLFILTGPLKAQTSYALIINPVDKDTFFLKRLNLKTSFQKKQQCTEYVQKLPALLQAQGFIAASVDSVKITDTYTAIHLFTGERYSLASIRVKEEDAYYLERAGVNINSPDKGVLNFAQYRLLQEKLLDYFENNGYPFASIQLDSIFIKEQRINAFIKIDKGIVYKIDSIRIYGTAKISRNFIHRYLNIERGSIYNKAKLDNINKRLLELPFIQQMQNWNITMLNTGSVVNLYLQPKKSNQVNVLAGFLPANQQTGGKLLLTVDANLQLKNAIGTGESFGLVWQQIQPKSPRLNVQFDQPYFLNSSFGLDFLFELYKKDSTFLNINAYAGVRYILSENQAAKVSIQHLRSNILSADTLAVKNTKRLPDIADVSSVNIGLDYEYEKTNYKFNPRTGNEIRFTASAGNKTLRKSTAITQIKDTAFNYSRLYDSVKLKTYQLRMKVQAAHYFPLGRQSVVKTGINAGWYESPSYFRNELFQIGGYKLLRGFDEESIFASSYAVVTVEYRYLLGLNSFFFGFTDYGASRDKSKIVPSSGKYIGAGLGLAFETKGGLFNISVAAGKRNDMALNIRQSKIHFGYLTVF